MVKSIWVLDSWVGSNINTTAPLGKRIITILNIHYRSNIVKHHNIVSSIELRKRTREKEDGETKAKVKNEFTNLLFRGII